MKKEKRRRRRRRSVDPRVTGTYFDLISPKEKENKEANYRFVFALMNLNSKLISVIANEIVDPKRGIFTKSFRLCEIIFNWSVVCSSLFRKRYDRHFFRYDSPPLPP